MNYILGLHVALAVSLTGIIFILLHRAPRLLSFPEVESEPDQKKEKSSILKQPCLVVKEKITFFQNSAKKRIKIKGKEEKHLQKDYWKKFIQEFKK